MNCEWIGWCALDANAQAAWVQAIGSVIAIFVAVNVPMRIARRERKRLEQERYYKSRSLAFVLKPLISNMRSGVLSAQYRWKRCPEKYSDDDVVQTLVTPDALKERLLDLHVLGEAGVAIERAIVSIENLRIEVFTQYAYWKYGGVYVDPETGEEVALDEPKKLDDAFTAADHTLSAAASELDGILEY